MAKPNNEDAKKTPSGQFNIGKVTPRPIVDEMETSYLDYAMSVIVQRALPDVRDGLKPVHRRVLYAMWGLGLRPNGKFRKSAAVVGEVLGNYHPHGEMAVYDTLVRMAQDFAMRYPLVKGQGNFGSIDGDGPAAMRYTESKMAQISEEILVDIERDTVDFGPNYDGRLQEPKVLPAKLPNLLLNGSVGIAVGMATNIPPHNLTEVCDAAMHLIDNPESAVEDLMQHIKGPDFPTGGTIYNKKEIANAYTTGRGAIVMRAKADIVEAKGGTFNIIVSEIPYQVNKSTLLEKIADLVKDKRIEGIRDIRDESTKEIRVVIELKKEAYPKKILNQLFKLSQLQETFHVNMLALVDGIIPRVLNLKMILEEYLKHRRIVIRRRTEFDLKKARDRAHILEGLVMALEDIDKIINTIKKSRDKDDAKVNLMAKFRLSERQAVAILEMRLQQLANLERLKVEEELKEKKKLIKELEELLKSEKKISGVIRDELAEIKIKYGDLRRTSIVAGAVGEFSTEDLIPNEATIVMITQDGYIKRLPPDTFRTQGRGGKGVIGVTTKEEDIVEQLMTTSTHSDLLFFTTKGRVFQLKAYDVPQASRTAKGQAIVNFLQLAPEEQVTAVLAAGTKATNKEFKYLFMVTRQGVIKKVDITAFESVRRSGLIAVKLRGDDELSWVKPSRGNDNVLLVTAHGQSIMFKETDVRAMGRNAAGVRGIRLKKDDTVVGMDVIAKGDASAQVTVVMENGYGKRTPIKAYRLQGRGGSGVKTAKTTPKTGKIINAYVAANMESDLIVVSKHGQVIRLPVKQISVLGRATQGVRLMRFKEEGDKVASVTLVGG
ncbi:DNA gyrase subunit A, partial [Candidatus Uhrbacteria bacterium]|nr:DNA gyrase subunit A [Candidatus Uhrbacteria bacterium]